MPEVTWIIETIGVPSMWWGSIPPYGTLTWSNDINAAVRFARPVDASNVIRGMSMRHAVAVRHPETDGA